MKTAITTPDLLERMAYNTGRAIELTSDAAFLTVGDVTWCAPLPGVAS